MLPKGYHMENKKKDILKNDVVLKHLTNNKGKTTLVRCLSIILKRNWNKS
jgi:hypothetical protein